MATQIFLCHCSEKTPTLAQASNFKSLHILLEGIESRFIRLVCTAYVLLQWSCSFFLYFLHRSCNLVFENE